jgi:hypothetical protein
MTIQGSAERMNLMYMFTNVNLLSDLGQQLQDPQVRNYRYGTIIKSLTSLISGNKACMKIKDDLPKLKITDRLAGNANNIL